MNHRFDIGGFAYFNGAITEIQAIYDGKYQIFYEGDYMPELHGIEDFDREAKSLEEMPSE